MKWNKRKTERERWTFCCVIPLFVARYYFCAVSDPFGSLKSCKRRKAWRNFSTGTGSMSLRITQGQFVLFSHSPRSLNTRWENFSTFCGPPPDIFSFLIPAKWLYNDDFASFVSHLLRQKKTKQKKRREIFLLLFWWPRTW